MVRPGIKQRKFTENRFNRSGILSKCPEYYLVRMNTHYIRKPGHLVKIVSLKANFVKFSIGFGDSIPHINKP